MVGTSHPIHPGPVTFKVTIDDTKKTRFQWVRTSNPSGDGMLWEQFKFRFDTAEWDMDPNQSGAIYVEAPRDLNPGKDFLGIDAVSLFRMESIISRFRN